MADDRIYLSHVLETEKFKRGQANIIVAPCHSGKTTAAITKVATMATSKKYVLILIDTTAGKDALAVEEQIYKYHEIWIKNLRTEKDGWGEAEFNDKIRVMTYHQLGYQIQKFPDFMDNIEIIICDEMHNLIKYMGIEYGLNKNNNLIGTDMEINTCKIAWNNIINAAKKDADVPMVIIMSATTNSVVVKLELDGVKSECFDYYGKVTEDKTNTRKFYGDVEKIIKDIKYKEKTVVYMPQIKMLKKYSIMARENGNNVCCLWGIHNQDNEMTDKQLEIRSKILKDRKIPPEVDVLFINAAYETSINMNNEDFKKMIIHSGNEDVQTQVRGRIRNDIDYLYIYDNDKSHIDCYFPDEYYEKYLSSEDTAKIAKELNLKDEKGNDIKWRKIKDILAKNGVRIVKSVKNNKRMWMLHKPV